MRKALIIGSTALAERVRPSREPKDRDVFTPNPTGDEEAFWDLSFDDWIQPGERIASLDELYTIKVSHSYWVVGDSWEKHMTDQMVMKEHGAQLDQPLHDLLYQVWLRKHGVKKVNLVQDKMDFFADAVRRIYEHDSIHEAVAYGDQPIYEDVVADGETVKMDMNKVWALPLDQQVRLFREEVYATALERYLIPAGLRGSPMAAYSKALRKTITSLTKGKSAQFMSVNYDLFRRPDTDYLARFKSQMDKLIPLEGK